MGERGTGPVPATAVTTSKCGRAEAVCRAEGQDAARSSTEEAATQHLNVKQAIASSCLLPFLEQELRAASLVNMSSRWACGVHPTIPYS